MRLVSLSRFGVFLHVCGLKFIVSSCCYYVRTLIKLLPTTTACTKNTSKMCMTLKQNRTQWLHDHIVIESSKEAVMVVMFQSPAQYLYTLPGP